VALVARAAPAVPAVPAEVLVAPAAPVARVAPAVPAVPAEVLAVALVVQAHRPVVRELREDVRVRVVGRWPADPVEASARSRVAVGAMSRSSSRPK
jgi:hypothetical protein